MKASAEDLITSNPNAESIIKRMLKEEAIGPAAAKFLCRYAKYGFYGPMSTGGYGMSDELRSLVETYFTETIDTIKEIAYRVPGKGGWKRRTFGSEAKADAFIDRLIRKEGDDVEIQCRYED